MQKRRMNIRYAAAAAAALAMVGASTGSGQAAAATAEPGTASLAALLAADGKGFDANPFDYDVLDKAVQTVLTAKPSSPVAVLADGSTPLTAFLPNDRAFRRLANDVLGQQWRSEKVIFGDLAGALGVDTIESVLLYHVVPGATITYRAALGSDGAELTTALTGSSVRVNVRSFDSGPGIKLVDADPDAVNARVVAPNLNFGNQQIAHGISRVLRPVDL